MRTTLTIDADLAARIERIREERRLPLKAIVNEALRAGLDDLERGPSGTRRFETEALSLGRCYVDNLDNVAEVLASAEGEAYR